MNFKDYLNEFRSVLPKMQPATKPMADVRDFRRLYGPTGSFIDSNDAQDISDVISQGISGFISGIGSVYRRNLEQRGITPAIPPTVVSFHKSETQGRFAVVGKIEIKPGMTPEDAIAKIERTVQEKYATLIQQKKLDPIPKVETSFENENGKNMLVIAIIYKPKNMYRQYLPTTFDDKEEEEDF